MNQRITNMSLICTIDAIVTDLDGTRPLMLVKGVISSIHPCQNKMKIWSSNMIPRTTNSTVVMLLETGNLAVLNKLEPSTIYWQSFDHPTDTWLPGARIGWNKAARKYVALTSWRSPHDPAPGYYSFGMNPNGRSRLVMMWNETKIYWDSGGGGWNGDFRNNYTTYSGDALTRFVLDFSGEGKQWHSNLCYDNTLPLSCDYYRLDWSLDWAKPENKCQVPLSFCNESSVPTGSRKGEKKNLMPVSTGGFLFFLAVLLVIGWYSYRYRRRGTRLNRLWNQAIEEPLVLFSYRDLRSSTKNFSQRLGGGGFGSVFKGELPDSTAIAVKRLEGFRQGEKQFKAEVSTMGVIHHVNLARLRGFCCEADKRLLVYDYMPNGSLDSVLFSTNTVILSWEERYKIALGTARGLAYLHEECRDCIIHCDIKPENVLLDEHFCAKLADFGMAKILGRDFSRVLTTMRGTIGYLAPEWISGLPITPKADVYSFGMLLFELISGKRNSSKDVDGDERFYFFPIWAAVKISSNDDNVLGLLDRRLEGNADVEDLCRACKVACWCIQDFESDRPSMGQVVQMLDGITEVTVPPVPIALKLLIDHADSTGFTSELLPSEPSTLDNACSMSKSYKL